MERATVDFVEYDEDWVRIFETEKELLTDVFGDNVIKIEHFGSTSVRGISAKPIIDIFVFVYDTDIIEQKNSTMENYGYSVKGQQDLTKCKVFIKHKSNSSVRTHKVNVCKENNQFAVNALLFRDYLRINKEARKKYDNLKKELSKKHYYDPIAYGNGKIDCITEIIEDAKLYYTK